MSIYKRNGTYYTDFYIDGKRFRRNTHANNKRIAELYENEVRHNLLKRGIGIPDKNLKLSELIDKYLSYSKNNNSPRTHQRDELSLRNFKENAKAIYLHEVTPTLMENYKSKRLQTVAIRTVNLELVTVKAMFNRAVEWKMINENPIKSVKKIKSPISKTIHFLEKLEIEKLLENANSVVYPIIYTFLKTGMRRDELVFLEWSDIDWKNKQIKIINKEVRNPKGQKERYIPMDDKLINILKSLPRNGSSFVFSTPEGKPRVNNLNREVKKVAAKAGIKKNINLHMLRHSFASHLVMGGVDLSTIQRLLGHSSITTTMIYAHLAPDHLRGALDKLKY